jgi:LPS sulfotransferase NodH
VSISEPIRIFVVGCPRSGTTLLQSLLAAHERLVSFPETHFFNYYARDGLDEWLEVQHSELREEMSAYFERLERPGWARAFARWYPLRRWYADVLVEAFDAMARERRSEAWLEKTPSHLERIDLIDKVVDAPRYIHIVRNGADVVASLHAVTHAYPEEWSGARSIDRCIDRWLRSVELTDAYLDRDNHTAIRYEDLARDTETQIERLCEFIDIDYEPGALERYRGAADRVVDENEPWKASNRKSIREPSSDRFYERFDVDQRHHILEWLSDTETDWPTEPAGDA